MQEKRKHEATPRVAKKHCMVVARNLCRPQRSRFDSVNEEVAFRTSAAETPPIMRLCSNFCAAPSGYVFTPAVLGMLALYCGFPPDHPMVAEECMDTLVDPHKPESIASGFAYLEARDGGFVVSPNLQPPFF
jgi:hypothetical protein